MTAGSELVLAEFDRGVRTLTLNRPDRLNAWNAALEARYFDLLDEADASAEVRVVVVTGAGRGFCAGADVSAVERRSQGAAPRVRDRPLSYPLSLRKPLIAAINGGCAGLGLLQALFCDLRFATADAKIATAFSRRGIPAEFGVSWLLQRLVGPAHAADLLLSGRVVRGDEAAAIGLVNQAFASQAELMEATLAYGRDVAANCSPQAMAMIKGQLAADWGRTRLESDADAVALMARPETQPDFLEGVAAFVEKRSPHFPGLTR
jgi:enoyl-CoA hydratase/carnithine racemase